MNLDSSPDRNPNEEKKISQKEVEEKENKFSFKKFSIADIKKMVEEANLEELKNNVSDKTKEDVEQLKSKNRVKHTVEVSEIPDKFKNKKSNYEKKQPNPKGDEITFGSKKNK